MEMGYSFVWIAKTTPWLVAPDGHRIDLEVHGNIPFLRVDNHAEQAMVAKSVPYRASHQYKWIPRKTMMSMKMSSAHLPR